MDKIKILVVPSDTVGGVGFYRSMQPHAQIAVQYPNEFEISINPNPNWMDFSFFDKFDIIHIHKGLYQNMGTFLAAMKYFKSKNIVTVMDIDDHFKLGPHHPQYATQRQFGTDKMIVNNFRLFDYVTTTTEIFANEIKKHNKNVRVFPNAINPEDERFKINKPKSDLIRVGIIMGSSHEYDVEPLRNLMTDLPEDVLNKVQIVLCGFDTRGSIRMINPETKEVQEREITPRESVWYRYEKSITNNYRLLTPEYVQYLEMFTPKIEWPNVEKEHYRRCWTKDINHYYSHYNNVDILLAPIESVEFNRVKSQLKVIECGFSHTALIASDFGPYTLDLKTIIKRGGDIDETGNAILIDERKKHKDWVKGITRLVRNPELITLLQNNIYETVKDKFDLRNVAKDRADFYKEIYNKAKENKVEG